MTNKQNAIDIKSLVKNNYVDRDLSWMYFNHRILAEAKKETVPTLERLKFLGIYSNNLDEFFRVRMAYLSNLCYSDKLKKDERHKVKKLIENIGKLNSEFAREYEDATKSVWQKLKQENIVILNDKELDANQQEFVSNFYKDKLNGNINPVWLSSVSQLDKENDYNIYLAVKMTRWGKENKAEREYAILELPTNKTGRFISIPDADGKKCLMYLDDVIRFCLPLIFEGMKYENYEAYAFKFTRNAEMEIDDDLQQSALQKITKGLKSRKRGAPLRIIYDEEMPKDLLRKLMSKMHLIKLDTILPSGRYHNHKDLMGFPDCGRKDLLFEPQKPMLKAELDTNESLLDLIRERDRFIHVPYHSFDSYIRVLREAAMNPNVKEIKTTIYRLAKDSKVVKALICAAQNGKKVTAVIELMARFDEEENIDWSKKMEDAGIRVLFGLEGLKIHSKLTYIEAKNGDIACVSTGNFHEGNAKTYTDYLLMTADKQIVKDVENVFEFIEKPYKSLKLKELLLSPLTLRSSIKHLLDTEIDNAKKGRAAYFKGKLNHITDSDIVAKIYEAAVAGVKIDLVVRGNCSLKTDMPELNGNLKVVGIIDRYLEHSRILIFANGGDEKYYLGSADWMPRNLDNRIEAMVPVYDEDIRKDLRRTVEYGLRDTLQGRIVDGTGKNDNNDTGENIPFASQKALWDAYKGENSIKTILETDIKGNNTGTKEEKKSVSTAKVSQSVPSIQKVSEKGVTNNQNKSSNNTKKK